MPLTDACLEGTERTGGHFHFDPAVAKTTGADPELRGGELDLIWSGTPPVISFDPGETAHPCQSMGTTGGLSALRCLHVGSKVDDYFLELPSMSRFDCVGDLVEHGPRPGGTLDRNQSLASVVDPSETAIKVVYDHQTDAANAEMVRQFVGEGPCFLLIEESVRETAHRQIEAGVPDSILD